MEKRINLNLTEIRNAALVGLNRQLNAIENDRQHINPSKKLADWQNHIEGACGELATAIFTGQPWTGRHGRRDEPDVGEDDVRTSPYDDGQLWLYPKEKKVPHRIFWLITGKNGKYFVRGWLRAAEGFEVAKHYDRFNNGRPAFWIEQDKLHPPETWPYWNLEWREQVQA